MNIINKSPDLVVSNERAILLKNLSLKLPEIVLNKRQLCDFELLANGAFSPLQGFMIQVDYESVLDRMRLQDGSLWPIPICLDISQTLAETLEVGQSVIIRDPEAFQLGMMQVEDIWPVKHEDEAIKVFGTKDPTHPGVNYLLNNTNEYYIGGKLEVISLPIHSDFKQIRLTPQEVKSTYQKLGWKRIVGFHTRNPIHRPQYEMTIEAMKQMKANLLLLANAGISSPNDFDYYTRVRCYNAVNKQYPPDTSLISLLPYAMRFSGAREAILHAIIAKNYGCTHFIVGHNHAMPGNGSSGNPFYQSKEIAEQTKSVENEIEITILPFEKMVYLPFEDEYRFINQVEDDTKTLHLSAEEIRKRIQRGKRIPDWAIFPQVEDVLKKSYPPPQQQGLTIFFTGLSGAGKSTIARILYAKFLELGNRPVTLLDGDIVRRNLSSELSFSKEHRDINVLRIGFVASEITKNRGIALCAPIAPYFKTRAEVRKNIDTSNIAPGEAVQEILLFLGQKGYI